MDGSRSENVLSGLPAIALCSGCWLDAQRFELRIRWVETCNEKRYAFCFDGDALRIETPPGPFGGEPGLIKARKQ